MLRLALFCPECRRRQFDDPNWRCPEHPRKTVVQANHPYFGAPVPTPKVEGLKAVGATAPQRKGA